MGIGRGDPQVVPAAHTDLILSALGEEWGFLGVAAVFALYAFLVWRALRIALRARTDYEFFLAAGLAAATALQILLIAGGALGVLPLSGVVTPFLSYGRTAMLANFVVLAILLSISSRSAEQSRDLSHDRQGAVPAPSVPRCRRRHPLRRLAAASSSPKPPTCKWPAAPPSWANGTLVVQADGARRYQYNPRFQDVMREIPKGTIYDRNGLPLATSNWDELEKHRAEYQQLGIDIDRACSAHRKPPLSLRRADCSTCWAICARASAGPPATPPSWSAIPPAACAATTTAPRWSKSRIPRPASWSAWSATITANWCRWCAIATIRRIPPCAACSTARATSTCPSTPAWRCGWPRSCASNCRRRIRTKARPWSWTPPPATCWPPSAFRCRPTHR